MPGLHFVPWLRVSGCLGAAAPVTGAAADEYNLNVVDCNASVTVARRSCISVSGGGTLACVFHYCRTYYKAVRVGEESGGHVL